MRDVIVIEAGRTERHYWLDLWHYRELFRVLAWRDLAVRYKQTVIGVLWALIRPFLTMLVFTVIFGRIAKLPSDGDAPYALMVLAGILPWTFFSTGLSEASNSLINNERLINKVYFPRLIVPIATIVVAFADFLISFCPFGIFGERWTFPLDYSAQCKIPRFSLRHPLHRAAWSLCVTRRIQFERNSPEVAVAVFA
jgi:lipopolysaccharide transport system permease protein